MFGKPKKRAVKADAPATEYEKASAKQAMQDKYPQMGRADWGRPVAKTNARTLAIQRGMGDSAGGIKTDAEKDAERQAKLPAGEKARYAKRKATREGTRR